MVRPHHGKWFHTNNPDFDYAGEPDVEITEYKIYGKTDLWK
jgi:hypothetical protein